MTGPAGALVRPFGDAAFFVARRGLPEARSLAAAVDAARRAGTAPADVVEAVVGFDSVVVRCRPGAAADDGLAAWLSRLATRAGNEARAISGRAGRTVTLPVQFDGPDLAAVADAVGATPSEVTRALIGTALQVALLGFAPGFPYLVGLPPDLAGVMRRPTPRPSVPAGSVAVGGGFASVYPQPSPGGWMIVGRTGARLFEPHRPPYALLAPGDTVRFSAATVDAGDDTAPTRARPPIDAAGPRVVEVLDPGPLTLVEDSGRSGVAALGVPDAGPADPESWRLANALVGNEAGEAGLEVTVRGPVLRIEHDTHLAVVAAAPDGAEVHLDGLPVGTDTVVPVRSGQVIAVGRVRAGLRAYVALSGGIRTEPVVGSRSSDQLSGLGPGPLRSRDRLGIGPGARPHGALTRPPAATGANDPIRVLPGPHPFPPDALDALCSAPWSVGPASNRIGLRLEHGIPLGRDAPRVSSTGMVTGAVQVPPDGNPIVLLVDHATHGGYPVVACVISADLPRLGQARAGDRLSFTTVAPAEARRAHRERARLVDGSVSGWFPTAAAT